MAAAHEKLPHFQMKQHMISNILAGGEGWSFIDLLENPCQPPDESGIFYNREKLPTFLHYCQTYKKNHIGFTKRRAPRDIFTCESPLFKEIPDNYYQSLITGNIKQDTDSKREAFMVCSNISVYYV